MADKNQIDFTVRITEEGVDKLGTGLERIDDQAQNVAKSGEAAGAGVDKLGNAADKAGAELDQLAAAADKADQQSGELKASSEGAAQEVADLGQDAQKAGDQVEQLSQAENKADQQASELARSTDSAGQAITDLAGDAQRAQANVAQLGAAEEKTQASTKRLGDGTEQTSENVTELGQTSVRAADQVEQLAQELDRKTSQIKAGLQLEQSEIDLQNRHLDLQRAEQQEIARTAQARGNESVAQQAQNRLREIEGEQLGLVARAKRAEATAIQEAITARREELAARGPIDAAAAKEIAAAENHARALRTEAAAADQAAQRVRQLGTDHNKTAVSTGDLSARVSGLNLLLGQMAGALSAAFSFRELVRAAADMEQLRSGLEAVWRDSQQAGKDLEFVRTVASRSGADVREAGKAWLGLAAATKGTAVEGEPTRRVFESVATAMGKAGKSSAETSNALLALQQMASKGTIQMEELRGQLGEALPGALQATAKGLGLTTKELIDMVEAGGLTATDLFPALAKGLDELYGGAQKGSQTLAQEIGNLKNAVTDLGSNIGEAGGLSALKVAAELAQAGIVTLDIAIVAAGKSIGTVFAALASWDFSGLKQSFADIEQEAKDKLLKAAQHNELLRNSLDDAGRAALEASIKQQEAGKAAAASGQAAAGAAPSWASLIALYSKSGKELADMTALAEKTAVVKNAEASAVVALAAAYGTEKEQRNAQAAAAATQAESLERISILKQSELVLLENELAALQALGKEQIQADPARQKQLQDLEKEIAFRRTVAESAQAQAREARISAEATKAEAVAVEDNSGKVKQLAEAYDQAKRDLELLRNLQALGIRTQRDVEAAENDLVRSSIAYKDALADQTKAARASQITKVSEAQATVSMLESQKSLASQSEQIAALMGNEIGVRRAKITQLEIDIKLTKAKAEVARAEAEGSIAVANATLAEMKANGENNPVKEAGVNASIRSAQAKLAEADAIRKSADVTEKELSNLRNGANNAGNGISSSMGAAREAVGGVGDAARDAAGAFDEMSASAEKAAKQVPKDNMGHETRTAGTAVGTRQGIIEWLKGAGLDEAVAEYISRDFVDASGNVEYMDNGGQKKWRGNTMSNALSNAVDFYKYGDGKATAEMLEAQAKKEKDAKEAKAKTTTAPSPAPTSSPAPAPASSGGASSGVAYVSNYNFPDQRVRVSYADSNSQQEMDAFLRRLFDDKRLSQ